MGAIDWIPYPYHYKAWFVRYSVYNIHYINTDIIPSNYLQPPLSESAQITTTTNKLTEEQNIAMQAVSAVCEPRDTVVKMKTKGYRGYIWYSWF